MNKIALTILSALTCVAVHAAQPAPYMMILDTDTVFYTPMGHRIWVPSGSEADLCPPLTPLPLMTYHLDPKVFQFHLTCVEERPLFSDGFEGDPPPSPSPIVTKDKP